MFVKVLFCAAVLPLLLLGTLSIASEAPNGQACLTGFDHFDFCNTDLTIDERTRAFVRNLTMNEKIGLLGGDPEWNTCTLRQKPIPRLGLFKFPIVLDELNSGACSACKYANRCATCFPSPGAIAATFNRTVFQQKGTVIGVEVRSMVNENYNRFNRAATWARLGVTSYGGTVNLALS